MSKVSDQKAACGYTPKVVPSTCGNCKHFASDLVLPDWAEQTNKRCSHPYYTAEEWGLEKNLRCEKHGFAVKKMAGCDDYGPAVK